MNTEEKEKLEEIIQLIDGKKEPFSDEQGNALKLKKNNTMIYIVVFLLLLVAAFMIYQNYFNNNKEDAD